MSGLVRLLLSLLALVHMNAALRAISVRTSAPRKLVGGVIEREHYIKVPLDWNATITSTIEIFVRELNCAKLEGSTRGEKPGLLYLQGGPGFASPRPSLPPSGWLAKALENHRVLLLDQRGTGLSSPVTLAHLARLDKKQEGVKRQKTDSDDLAGAEAWLACMRTDSIACDVEAVRREILGANATIGLLGQSFGGFVMLAYLSRFADNCARCLFTCGLAPVRKDATQVYEATAERMIARNKRFYDRYPDDVDRVRAIATHLAANNVKLKDGGDLTLRRFLMLGLMLGSSSGMENLHWLLEGAWDAEELSESFLRQVEAQQSAFETNPIYYLLHEAIYCDGKSSSSKWAAQKVIEKDPRFDHTKDASLPIQFTGEMVFSWMAQDFAGLRPHAALAESLAQREWADPLYDLEALLNVADKVPIAALVSYDDVYVERQFSEDIASHMGAKLWVTNEFQHSGLRDDGARVFETLLKMTNDEISLPS